MLSYSFCLPILTAVFGAVIIYIILIVRKILEESNQKTSSAPDLQDLQKSLPLNLNTSWKLIDVINGVPIWEDQRISDCNDNGIIACQALIQATSQATISELIQPRILSMVHPTVDEINIVPVIHRSHAESDVKHDVVSAQFSSLQIASLFDLFLYFKNICDLKRQWRCDEKKVAWLSVSPEYKIFANKFGNWQLYIASDLPNESKDGSSNISLLTMMVSPNTNKSSFGHLKMDLTAQIVCIREHMDSLYLGRLLQNENMKVGRGKSVASPQHNANKNKQSFSLGMPKKSPSYEGKEELGYVEGPAEIKAAPLSREESAEDFHKEQVENEEFLLVKKNILKYKSTIDEAFRMLMDIYDANGSTPNWSYVGNKQDVDIFRMQGDAACPSDCFKGTAEVNVPVSYAVNYVTEIDYKREWDDLFIGGNTIEEIDEVTKVTYMEYKPVWPTSARDFCSITATRHVKDNVYATAVKAISHHLCPPVKGKQRAEAIVGGFIIEGVTDNPPLCKVTFVTRADLKGRIPSSMVNKVNEKQPLYAGVIRDKLTERYLCQDPVDEGHVKLMAARRHESIREFPPDANDKNDITSNDKFCNPGSKSATEETSDPNLKIENEISSNAFHTPVDSDDSSDIDSSPATPRSNPQLSNQSVTMTSASKESFQGATTNTRQLSDAEIEALFSTDGTKWDDSVSVSSIGSIEPESSTSSDSDEMKPISEQDLDLPRDQFGNLDFQTYANQAAASVLEEVLLASKVDIKNPERVDVNQPDVWTFQGIFRNVVVLRKIHKNSNIHSFLGRGIMQVLPLTVWEAIKNPATRFVYDNMLKKTKIVKEFDEKTRIMYMRHETTACFVRQARDFVVLLGERVEQGKYVLSARSVQVPECPLESSCVRGKVLSSGWTIESVMHHGKQCSLVTYLSQIDFGGKIPVRIINHVAKRQPMSIAYLRKYLEEAEKGK